MKPTSTKPFFLKSVAAIAFACLLLSVLPACKHCTDSTQLNASGNTTTEQNKAQNAATVSYQTLTATVTVAGIRPIEGSTAVEVMFNENAEFFTATDAALVAQVKDALATGKALTITFDPWQGVLVSAVPGGASTTGNARVTIGNPASARNIDLSTMSDESLNDPDAMGIINTTETGLTNLIPDFATAQLMFDYISHQCCALPGPYAVDHCITFQYCPDGCYARAHKMCWIINNRYKYGTKKVFSFANAGSDKLCVQAQKWGGCCIRWWYHVAPLVTVQTPTGPKAYVFDPAMFDQPVLLATWLHAQENPACAAGYTPNVTMINVQPTTAYTPASSSGYTFSTDPTYSSTNSTLTSYRYLTTCP